MERGNEGNESGNKLENERENQDQAVEKSNTEVFQNFNAQNYFSFKSNIWNISKIYLEKGESKVSNRTQKVT